MIDVEISKENKAGNTDQSERVYLVSSAGGLEITTNPEAIEDRNSVYALTEDDLQFIRDYDENFQY